MRCTRPPQELQIPATTVLATRGRVERMGDRMRSFVSRDFYKTTPASTDLIDRCPVPSVFGGIRNTSLRTTGSISSRHRPHESIALVSRKSAPQRRRASGRSIDNLRIVGSMRRSGSHRLHGFSVLRPCRSPWDSHDKLCTTSIAGTLV